MPVEGDAQKVAEEAAEGLWTDAATWHEDDED